MKYKEFTVTFPVNCAVDERDIVIANLADLGFESFSEDDNIVKAYIQEKDYVVNSGEITDYLAGTGYKYVAVDIEDDTNWNAVWESNFQPIEVAGRCYVRAPFHAPKPDMEYDIVIMPKMSFGTGHHATTYLMLEAILGSDMKGKKGLDMGSGTGVLAILAVKSGAERVDAIDVDEWAFRNCEENIEENGVEGDVEPMLGDSSLLPAEEKYDFILANINRNILLGDMGKYAACLKRGGEILFSGFLEIDVDAIREGAVSAGLKPVAVNKRDGWCMVKCVKEK